MPLADLAPADVSGKTAQPVSCKTAQPVPPTCPTCGQTMRLTGVVPTCEDTIYDYVCSNDGDRLSWRPHRLKDTLAA